MYATGRWCWFSGAVTVLGYSDGSEYADGSGYADRTERLASSPGSSFSEAARICVCRLHLRIHPLRLRLLLRGLPLPASQLQLRRQEPAAIQKLWVLGPPVWVSQLVCLGFSAKSHKHLLLFLPNQELSVRHCSFCIHLGSVSPTQCRWVVWGGALTPLVGGLWMGGVVRACPCMEGGGGKQCRLIWGALMWLVEVCCWNLEGEGMLWEFGGEAQCSRSLWGAAAAASAFHLMRCFWASTAPHSLVFLSFPF